MHNQEIECEKKQFFFLFPKEVGEFRPVDLRRGSSFEEHIDSDVEAVDFLRGDEEENRPHRNSAAK